MASRRSASLAIFLSLNLLFFALATATATATNNVPCPPPPPKKPKPTPCHTCKPPPSNKGKCPKDVLKLGVCADLLGLVHVIVGSPPTKPCCTLLEGLADLEAAVCLCTAIKANVLGLHLNVPVSLSLLLNVCGKSTPKGFKCS